MSFLLPLPLVVYSSLAHHLFICPSLPLSVSVFFFSSLSTRLLCALPVSQRIPLVAQLRDSAGKLRLFKARSAGKASSCWKEAAWTWRTSPSCLHTLAHKHRHTHVSFWSTAFLLPCLPAFPTWKMPFLVRFFLSAFRLWTFVTETRETYFHRGTHSHARAFCRGLMVSIFVNWISQIHWSHLWWWHI